MTTETHIPETKNDRETQTKISGLAPADALFSLTIETLREILQSIGYRVETLTDGQITFLRSATNGLPFDIRPGNSFAGAPDRFADVAFLVLFAVQGTLPLDLVNDWNRSRRFGRLFLDTPAPGQTFLVFCQDLSVAGGITPVHLRSQIEIWDGLVQQFVPWLRAEVAKIAPSVDGVSASTQPRNEA
ncbi:YbjN domain-containing protein [Rhodomicrobium lacus]|uniref:YbjN domain-containing protein n=1 Tax=Rhodomicrobium lacus TaxID=2498452 RepID=UPI000F8CCCBB|nr:YbjN domain-containing protein [Rhodomicrobium lacus]